MENLKNTPEYVKELAKEFYPPQTDELICSPKLVRDSYQKGYMKALEETGTSELLVTLDLIFQSTISSKTDSEKIQEIFNLSKNVINKATK